MDLNSFVKDAVRTESKIDNITLDVTVFSDLTEALLSLGEVLDQIKKHVFYNKPFNVRKLKTALQTADDRVLSLNESFHRISWFDATNVETVNVNARIFHSIVGIVTESIELLSAMNLDSKEVDRVNVLEEFGDLSWYVAIGIDQLDAKYDDVLDRVIAKLKARYPEKFTSENAIVRNLERERSVLENDQ